MRRHFSTGIQVLVATSLAAVLTAPSALAQSVSTFASGQPYVRALAFDGAGTMYVARRTSANVLVKCVPPSNTMTLVASAFADPVSIVCDAAGNIYVADYDYGGPGGGVRKVTPGGAKSTFAAVPNPASLAMGGGGNLYVGRWDGVINTVTPGGAVSTYVDLKTVTYLGVSGLNNHVTALVYDTDGTLYAGVSWGAIFKIGPGGSPIGGIFRIPNECHGLVMGPDGYLYGSSYTYNAIWKISTAGAGVLFAGQTNVAGFVNGPLLSARFNDPAGLAVGNGILYIADYSNSAVRATALDTTSAVTQGSWGRLKSLFH